MHKFIIRKNFNSTLTNHTTNTGGGIFLHHLSDLHIWQPEKFHQPITVYSLFRNSSFQDWKQIQGYLNIKHNRGPNLYQYSCLKKALQEIGVRCKNDEYSHLVITGDVTNISHPEEFELARNMLNEYFVETIRNGEEFNENLLYEYCSIIPGNHDAYTPSSVTNNYFGHYFGNTLGLYNAMLTSDPQQDPLSAFSQNAHHSNFFLDQRGKNQHLNSLKNSIFESLSMNDLFPNVKILSNAQDGTHVLILSLSSSVPQKPFVAGGVVEQTQLEQASKLMKEIETTFRHEYLKENNDKEVSSNASSLFKVVLMHHPPVERAKDSFREYLNGLEKKSKQRIVEFCDSEKIDLLLHGHTHVPYLGRIGISNHETLVIDNGSTTYVNEEKPYKMARYHSYHIKGKNLVGIEQHVWNTATQVFERKELVLDKV
ncbi:hypothetical protein C9374_010810 [Naegleria lovaniensis]|uniref:Calcineurin-like phosphoesterase domain-containing protein n=1 Tax=Naegleria lovaniensis TaxID=51637 RepID=A0AA88KFZ9_NAELO|nr:uncharacterized protein C9374_010810 [Naegleria lovaniensis]KAG2374526.1 hypothetical protein C9374_010810 [Naegleria lovaniensis]